MISFSSCLLRYSRHCLDVYYYDPEDITVLIDDDNPDHIQPTKENMVLLYMLSFFHLMHLIRVQIQKMIELVDGALAGDRFFFHCL